MSYPLVRVVKYAKTRGVLDGLLLGVAVDGRAAVFLGDDYALVLPEDWFYVTETFGNFSPLRHSEHNVADMS